MTPIPSIPREALVASVEAGIHQSDLPAAAVAALREVSTKQTQIGVGQFGAGQVCGCPMTEAGLTSTCGRLTPLAITIGVSDDQKRNFTTAFDAAADRFIQQHNVGGGFPDYEYVTVSS